MDCDLIKNLQNINLYNHRVSGFEIVETHISWILLTGEYAYKIKKPVDFEFVNFTSLEKRCYYCYEELRLNRRLAPNLYLDVCAITGSVEQPVIGGTGPAIEYMVKMKQFEQRNLLSNLVKQKEISYQQIDSLATTVAVFHQQIESAGRELTYGNPEQIYRWVEQNFQQIRPFLQTNMQLEQLHRLQEWTLERYSNLEEMLDLRKRRAFIRECHGDLHLGNIALIDGELVVFDGIEFNNELRWIDVMSEIAFLMMDLSDKDEPAMANSFLDQYLTVTGDYDGLSILPFYLVYRALVRAKIDLLTSSGESITQHHTHSVTGDYQSYVDLALNYTRPPPAALYITHGLAGSGKSTLARTFAQELGAVRIRSDVERKRMFGLAAGQRTDAGLGTGIYSADATRATYTKLSRLGEKVLKAGYSVIIDAGFLQQWQRHIFQRLAQQLNVRFVIINLQAPLEVLRKRVRDRWHKRKDPSEASLEVLESQIINHQPLTAGELDHSIAVESTGKDYSTIVNKIIAIKPAQFMSNKPRHPNYHKEF